MGEGATGHGGARLLGGAAAGGLRAARRAAGRAGAVMVRSLALLLHDWEISEISSMFMAR